MNDILAGFAERGVLVSMEEGLKPGCKTVQDVNFRLGEQLRVAVVYGHRG